MCRHGSFLLLAFSFFLLVGCGDSPQLASRDTLTFLNELCDNLNRIPDDETSEAAAEKFLKNPAILFKERRDALRHRWEIYRPTDKEAVALVKDAKDFWEKEYKALVKRRDIVIGRLDRYLKRMAEEEVRKENNPQAGRFAQIGAEDAEEKKLQEKTKEEIAARGQTLTIIQKDKVGPNLSKVLKTTNEIWRSLEGSGPVIRPKRKDDQQ